MDELIFRKVKTAADIRNLPGWVGRVDPQTVKLKRVIWPYHLPHEMPCSLTNCGTPHKDGVLIELEDGRISNIGHICGADTNKFGDDFLRAKAAMSEEKVRAMILLALEDRQTLNSIRSSAAEVENSVVLWANRVRKFAAAFPTVYDELNRRRNGVGSLTIYEEHERSERQISEVIEQGQARSREEARYYQEERGRIQGIDVLDLTVLRVDALVRRADAICAVDPTAMKIGDLNKLYNDLNNLPEEIRKVSTLISAGHRFFSAENLRLLSYLPMMRPSRDRLSTLKLSELDKLRLPNEETPEQGLAAANFPRKLNKKQRDHFARAAKQAAGRKR